MAEPEDFGFGEEEQLVRDLARRFLAEHAPVEKLRERVAGDHREAYESEIPPLAYDEKLWKRIVELGWTGLAIPVKAGGVGMKMVALAALSEELGRAALPSPLTATLLAACVVRQAPEKLADAWLEQIAGGSAATLAVTNADGSWESADTDVVAEPFRDGVSLRGTASFVQDARKASFFVVSARSAGGVGLYCVDAGAPGVSIAPDRIVDLTRDQARVELRDVQLPADAVIALPGTGDRVLERALPELLTIIASDICGAAEWQLQATASYAQIRVQFDRPIGFFQAVKHPLVNMMLDVDRARSLVYAAACAIDCASESALRLARMAKSAASDAAEFCSNRSLQLRGGIGFTWECDVHIYFKRQKHNQFLLGDGIYQRARLADRVGV